MSKLTYIEAHAFAVELVKRAGFQFQHASRKDLSCYYYHPARAGDAIRDRCLLRLSTHKKNKPNIGVAGTGIVISSASFTEADEEHRLTTSIVENRIKWAIGHYFMADAKPSNFNSRVLSYS